MSRNSQVSSRTLNQARAHYEQSAIKERIGREAAKRIVRVMRNTNFIRIGIPNKTLLWTSERENRNSLGQVHPVCCTITQSLHSGFRGSALSGKTSHGIRMGSVFAVLAMHSGEAISRVEEIRYDIRMLIIGT